MYYSNNKKTYTKKYKKINPWLFAISVSVIMYALLYFLFDSADIKVNKTTKATPHIIMLPLNKQKISSDQKQLLYWLKDDNPTLIVQPNTLYGYSSILDPDYKLSKNYSEPDIDSVLDSGIDNFTQITDKPFNIDIYTPMQLLSKLDLVNTPNIPFYPFQLPKNEEISYPCVRSYYTGRIIPLVFKNSEKIEQLVQKYNPQKPTVLMLIEPTDSLVFPIVNIISSCDSKELDYIAVKSLSTADALDFSFADSNKTPTKVYVQWR